MGKKKNMSSQEKAILKRVNELKYPTDRLGPSSLMTQQTHINASRMIMVGNQLSQMVSIKDPEQPLVPTGFENVLGSFSSMLDKTDQEYEVVAKFVKNDYNYILIGYDKKHRRFHAWKRVELEEHSEGFATRYNNNYIDSLEIGDVIPKDTMIQKSTNFDKYGNYCYGKNVNTVYLLSAQILEDGILAMNNVDSMMVTTRADTQIISIGENELLLNWYGDDDHYQGIPRIGEKTRKDIIAVVRRVDNAKAPYTLKKKRLRHIERGSDRRYFGKGRVIDIDIRYNGDEDHMPEAGANKMIRDLYHQQQEYYHKLYDYMKDIIDDAENKGYTYTDEFSMYCAEAFKYIDAMTYFTDSNDNVFGNMQIIVHLMDDEKLNVGSKLVGRSGNKGVISHILPPEESWFMEDGTPIHLVVAALGIVGRLNPAQLNEFSVNELSATAVEMMKATPDVNKKLRVVYNLMKFLNSDEADDFKKWCKKLDDKDKAKFAKRIEREGIIIVQDPIDNANIFDIAEAYEHFPAKWQRIVFPDGKKSMRKVLCSKMFYVRLKQDPLEKYSVRSRGPVNPLTTLPAKSNMKKKGLEPFSDVPVRFGEYEIEIILAMVNHPAAVAAFMTENSTSWPAKVMMAEHNYLGDIDLTYEFEDEEDVDAEAYLKELMENDTLLYSGKKNMEAISAYANVLGDEIEIEIEDAPDGEWFEDL